jgi:hypothetical protein
LDTCLDEEITTVKKCPAEGEIVFLAPGKTTSKPDEKKSLAKGKANLDERMCLHNYAARSAVI